MFTVKVIDFSWTTKESFELKQLKAIILGSTEYILDQKYNKGQYKSRFEMRQLLNGPDVKYLRNVRKINSLTDFHKMSLDIWNCLSNQSWAGLVNIRGKKHTHFLHYYIKSFQPSFLEINQVDIYFLQNK